MTASTAFTTVCLDGGNTLIAMDYELLREMLGAEGFACTGPALARAEAAARPALSRFLHGGASTETAATFAYYVRETLAHLGFADVPAPRVDRLVAAMRALGTRRLWSQVLPGVPEALRALRAAGRKLVVVSNADGTVEDGLTTLGLRPLLDAVVDSTVVGIEKPDPRIFAHALGLVGGRPETALHAGDLYSIDVVGARAAGIHPVLIDPYGDWPDADCERVPDLLTLARQLIQ